MTPLLVLFLLAVTIACLCFFNWLHRLTQEHLALRLDYIQLLSLHQQLENAVAQQTVKADNLLRSVNHYHQGYDHYKYDIDGRVLVLEETAGVLAKKAALASLPEQDLRNQERRAKILMYEIAGAQNLAGNTAPTLYGRMDP